MALRPWLIDQSAYTRLEIGCSFRTAAQAHSEVVSPPLALMPIEYMTPAIEDRAREIQLILTDRGLHRAPSIPDLLIAATAELAGLTVLSLDKDFDLIAEISGQPVEVLRMG